MDCQLPISIERLRIIFYPASGGTVILSIGGSRLFPCNPVSCHVIPMDKHWFVYIQKNYIQQHEPHGARFKRLFQQNQPSMETTMKNYNYPEKLPY